MSKILVSGLINIETTLKISGFPLEYNPVNYPFFGVNSSVSGVGMNLSKALTTLGDDVRLLSMVGNDLEGDMILKTLSDLEVDITYINRELDKSSQSVILYEESGRRQIHCDLKDVQDRSYDEAQFENALEECEIAMLCNINFSRPFLKLAREKGKIVATDVHVIADINDAYNSDFMKYANILFMSNENIIGSEEEFVQTVIDKYDNDIIVVGLGAEGALLYVKEDKYIGRYPAVFTRAIVNTIGAGDSLFSAFIHFYNKDKNPYEAIKKAIVFASYKIGVAGAADGFVTEEELLELYK